MKEYIIGYTKNEDGQLHKKNGPARLWNDKSWEWLLNGEYHRYYGPHDSYGNWWIHNRIIKIGCEM